MGSSRSLSVSRWTPADASLWRTRKTGASRSSRTTGPSSAWYVSKASSPGGLLSIAPVEASSSPQSPLGPAFRGLRALRLEGRWQREEDATKRHTRGRKCTGSSYRQRWNRLQLQRGRVGAGRRPRRLARAAATRDTGVPLRVFLSYASEDRPIAERVSLALQGAGHEVFFDRTSLPSGDTFELQILRGSYAQLYAHATALRPGAL